MKAHIWVPVHHHTNPLNGGALGAGAMDSVPGVGVAPSSVEDPFFIADPSSILTSPPPLTLRLKNLGGDYYQVIASANGDGNTDAYVLINEDSLLLNLFDNPGLQFSAVELQPSGVFVEGEQIVIESTGTGNAHKVYLDSNVGVVIADLATDPDGAHSEQAQIYYNTTRDVFRWYDGAVWRDVGSAAPDLVTGESSLFETTIGSWTGTGGTLTWSNDSNYFITGGSGSAKFVSTASGQHMDFALAGTFSAGHVYDGLAWIAFEENVFAASDIWTLELGKQGTDTQGVAVTVAPDLYFVDGNGYYFPLRVRWEPSADRTGVTLRLSRATSGGPPTVTAHVGLIRVAEVMDQERIGLGLISAPYAADPVVYLNAGQLGLGAFGSFVLVQADGVLLSDQYGGSTVKLGRSKITMTGDSGGVVLPKFSADPSSPEEGETYMNTTTHKVRTYDGTAWQNHW